MGGRLLGRDAVVPHVREHVFEHSLALGSLLMDEYVGDAYETAGLESLEDCSIELALLIVSRDVVERERGDNSMASGNLVLDRPCRTSKRLA
jgi:hypothetical protein